MKSVVILLLNTFFAIGAARLCLGQTSESQNPAEKPSVRSKSCDGCKPAPGAIEVTISCSHDSSVRVSPEHVFAQALNPKRDSIVWLVHPAGKPAWSVKFEKKTPCQRSTFDDKTAPCQIRGAAGEYSYEVRLHGCANRGKGKITVE